MEVHNVSVAGLGRRVKFVPVRMGVLHVQNPLADVPSLSNFEDAHRQLRGMKLAQVTFAILPILFDQTHTAHRMYLSPFILHAVDIRFKESEHTVIVLVKLTPSQLMRLIFIEFSFGSLPSTHRGVETGHQ